MMIKKCELSTCCNFFTVFGNRKKYCRRKCGVQAGRKRYEVKNKDALNRQRNERRRLRYKLDREYRAKKINKAAMHRDRNKDNENYINTAREHKLRYSRSKRGLSKMREYRINREKHDLHYKMTNRLRSLVHNAIKRRGGKKSFKTIELLGCSIEHAVMHLEKQFADGMTWDNYGDWHIDHIKPCAAFDLSDPKQQKKCCHYSNLQPLWAKDNLRKGATYEPSQPEIEAAAS